MGYKPTLGGLRKAQEFLSRKGHPMPVFMMQIYEGGGSVFPIQSAISERGPMYEMVDVRLVTEHGDKFIEFSGISHVPMNTGILARENGWDAVLQYGPRGLEGDKLKNFMSSSDGAAFVNLARWGKEAVSMLDRIKFRCFPKRYANEVFA